MTRARGFLWAAALLFLVGLGRDRVDAWIDATVLPPLIPATSVEVLDRNGTLLRAYTVEDGRWRMPVSLADVDPEFITLLLNFEDRRFWTHPGVDWRAMARAGWQALSHGRIVSGASTITMQVARLLEDSGTGTWSGKLRQVRLALALERHLSKEEILTLYLHLAPYGGNIEGVRAATLTWFGQEPAQLTTAEAALLVAIPQAPTSRRPDRNPDNAHVARDRVLDRALSFGVLTQDEVAWALQEPLPDQRHDFPLLAPHLADRMVEESPSDRHVLTIDALLQRQMQALAQEAVRGQGARLNAAVMVMDHQTGDVLASVGSASYDNTAIEGFVDMTRALRSPGSTLKPLIYGLGFEAGLIHPESLIEDRPTRFGTYAPQNFDRMFHGELSVRRALQASLNIPAVALLQEVSPAELMTRMRRAGMSPELPAGQPGLAVALGGVGVTMEDLMRLYGALASGGELVPLHYRPGRGAADPLQVLSPVAAWYVGDILSDMVPPPNAPRNGLAYKTGTSYGHRDAWALGYDGRYVVGVWLGRADGASVPGAFGADVAAPLLFEAFSRVAPRLTPLPPPPEAALTVSHDALPLPLQHFAARDSVGTDPDAPEIAFPPDGAVLAQQPDLPLMARVERGTPPYTWLWNGRPVEVAAQTRDVDLGTPSAGFVDLTVIDSTGRAASVFLEITQP
ncbi:penicillin-binding protein 1C [Nioella nitratireducens]|uniref:penicillin-binding protein 1C n=1 Tax=Nioella nitratireducens TaxID=1287720 RepID=UPI0008FD6D53|nr:penicillin-binding protein 1C [Nioella nitratireducens]